MLRYVAQGILSSVNARSSIHCGSKLSSVKDISKLGMASAQGATKEEDPPKKGFRLEEKQGDLFSCPDTDSLAHCISADVRMGKGIAVAFRKKFGMVTTIKSQKKGPGEVAVLEKDGRFIYNLVTKVKFNNKPTKETLKSSLEDMKGHCEKSGVTAVSMPKIGSGLDKLDWNVVKTVITEVFEDTDISITVYCL